MAEDYVRGGGLPDSLAGADPFAAPIAAAAAPVNSQRRPAHPDSVTRGASVPCPCACSCGNDTGKTWTDIESQAAIRFLRCEPCGTAMHFGPKWNTAATTSSGRAARMGPEDTVTVGQRGHAVVVRKQHEDPDEDQWNRQIAAQLEAERREEAATRWFKSLPERWQKPYDEGEELLPQVEDRLKRFSSDKGSHGTSLVCIGTFGSGKTWVAYTYARAAVDRRLLWPQEIRIGTESEIMEPIALASPWEVAEKTSALLKPSLKMLVIDDVGALGTYKNQENRFATWTKVVNWMYEHKRALVLTTNKTFGLETDTPKEDWDELLVRWIGPTAYERLKHMVGKNQVFRDENKRAELTARWEAEYQAIAEAAARD